MAALTIIFGELVPKTFAIHHADWVCRRLSRIMEVFAYTVHPLVASFEWVTKKFVSVTERLFKRDPKQAAQLSKARAGAESALQRAEEEWLAASSQYDQATG